MTLCTAWIRKVDKKEELIFATDSCLSSGERWKYGVKLFELPRKDCLICFAGNTQRTYPLILNLISSIKFDEHLSNPHTDISEVLEYLTELFTKICNSITNYGNQSFERALGVEETNPSIADFNFIFGGWSWKSNGFKLWTLNYKFEVKAFLPTSIEDDRMVHVFIGDAVERATEMLENEIASSGKVLGREFDMEPFKVLLKAIREPELDSIDGAIQIAKIYPPGYTEFFGVMWPSINGKKTFLGKEVSFENNPSVKYLDPDTCTIVGDELPLNIENIDEALFGVNLEFVIQCYPDKKLKSGLNSRIRSNLKRIFQEIAYSNFISVTEKQEEEAE